MFLDIKQIHYQGLNCIEDNVISVVSWKKHNYELAFSECWSFKFNDESEDIIGKRIEYNNDFLKLLELYHGVKITINKIELIDCLYELIYSELKKSLPVIINLDSFWCPWDNNFQKHHSNHYFLVSGIDEKSKGLYCIDAWFDKNNILIDYELVKNGYKGNCLTFNFVENQMILNNWTSFAIEAVNKLREEVNSKNCFDMIRSFSKHIETNLDLNKEFFGYSEKYWLAPIFTNIENIANGRYKFSKMISYFANQYNATELIKIAQDLNVSASKWTVLKQLCVKSYIKTFDLLTNKKLSEKLLEIADWEEQISNSLYEIALLHSNANYKNNEIFNINDVSESCISNKLVLCDINDHFNNQGLGSSVSNDCTADLTGVGEYFLLDEISDSKLLIINNNMKFLFPAINEERKDNIACSSQQINLNISNPYSIIMLGCADFGNYIDYLKIQYIDGSEEDILVQFTDWYFDFPHFNETIAWEGKFVVKKSDLAYVTERNHRIFAKEYKLSINKNIEKIILPNCPNIHIFAITFKVRV